MNQPPIKKFFVVLIMAVFCLQIIVIPRQAKAIPVEEIGGQLVATVADFLANVSDIAQTWIWKPLVEGFPASSAPSKLSCAIFSTAKGTMSALIIPPGLSEGAVQELLGKAIVEASQKAGEEGAAAAAGTLGTTADMNSSLGCIAANTSILAEKAVKNDVKESLLRVIARGILRLTVQEIKRTMINFIVTGNLGTPTFITNFTGDLKLAAENAIRGYLSQVTNINFCNFFPPVIPAIYTFNFNFYLQCSLSRTPTDVAWTAIRDLYNWEPYIRTTLSLPQNNYAQIVADIAAGKINNAAQAAISLAAEATAGGGYLSIKSPRFPSQYQDTTVQKQIIEDLGDCQEGDTDGVDCGKVTRTVTETVPNATKIPGKTVGELVSAQLHADALGPEVAREIDDALVEIAVVALQRVVNQGLSAIFR